MRWGRLGNQWWTFDPAYGDYVHLGAPKLRSGHLRPREWFFWMGVKGRARVYNALLEGQFRDSAVTFSRSDLRVLTAEAAAGFTADILDTTLQATFELRYRTREIPDASGESPVWGCISVSHSFCPLAWPVVEATNRAAATAAQRKRAKAMTCADPVLT